MILEIVIGAIILCVGLIVGIWLGATLAYADVANDD